MKKDETKNNLHELFQENNKIFARFRNINIALFLFISIIMAVGIFVAFQNITNQISTTYAKLHTINTSRALSSYLKREIALMEKVANSKAIINWFADETNYKNKIKAHEEITHLIHMLFSDNVYIGIDKSLHEYTVEHNSTINDMKPLYKLDPNYFDDAWYFKCAASNENYTLNVDIDKVKKRKRVWLNCKVYQNNTLLGILCTGLNFSKIVEEILSQYNTNKIRGLIIDGNGIVRMDSNFGEGDEFLNYEDKISIDSIISDSKFHNAVKTHIDNIKGYFKFTNEPVTVELSTGSYRYVTIAPLEGTDWSLITIHNSSSLFNITKLFPLFIIMLAFFVVYVLVSYIANYQIIFVPLNQLIDSLSQLGKSNDNHIYGVERNDEFGFISNTIQELFIKGHYDALTGLYNRRFMEENLQSLMDSISDNDKLSILIADVDFFKQFNDKYGHGMGDSCLKSIAKALTKVITRTDDIVARYGGEEFVVILPDTDKDGALVVASKLLKNVQKLNIPHEFNTGAGGCVTISIGVTTGNITSKQKWEDYLKKADDALYLSKQNGRNQFTFLAFESEDNDS